MDLNFYKIFVMGTFGTADDDMNGIDRTTRNYFVRIGVATLA